MRLKHQRARAVTEQHAGAPVGPVHQAGKGLGPDHQRPAHLARDDQRIGIGQRINETGTDRLDVIGETARHPQACLHHGGGGGEGQIGGRGGDNNRVNIVDRQPGIGQSRLGRAGGKVRGRLTLGHEMPPLDSGTGANPFV